MTVQDLIDELKRFDPHARVGVVIKNAKGYTTVSAEVDRVEPDHSTSKIGVKVVGEG